jgi:hypothetical protein
MDFLNVAVDVAAARRQMAVEVLALLVTKEAESVLSPEEIDYAWREAVRQGWAADNRDGTYTLTVAGRKCIDKMQVTATQ